ncbi:hypothetical protein G0U57_019708, partial [Chelydra serpentina]
LPLAEAPRGRAQGWAVVQGIEGQSVKLEKSLPLLVKVGDCHISHQFVCSPSCPIALLGRDLLTKLQAEISFNNNGTLEVRLPKQQISNYQMALLNVKNPPPARPESEKNQLPGVNPEVWAEEGGFARARNVLPVHISLKEGSRPVRIRQYPLKLATRI